MRFITYFLFTTILLCLPAFSKPVLLNQSEDWETLGDDATKSFAIVHQENNAVISLHILPYLTPYLTISLSRDSNLGSVISSIRFEIDRTHFDLPKDYSANDKGFDTFKIEIPEDQLKFFIHKLTSGKAGLIIAGPAGVPISLKGTSKAVSTVLEYVEKNNITNLPKPFDYTGEVLPLTSTTDQTTNNASLDTMNYNEDKSLYDDSNSADNNENKKEDDTNITPKMWNYAIGIMGIYFFPTIVAMNRRRNTAAIFVLNLFFGWTLLGWVICLVWALTKEKQIIIINQRNQN